MQLLVTGGAGFIGSHLIDALLEQGHSVVCLDDLSLGQIESIEHHSSNGRFEFLELDLCDLPALSNVFAQYNPDCVFHLAANSDIAKGAEFMEVDLQRTFMTTFNVLQCMQRCRVGQIVFASSSAVHGDARHALKENSGPLKPVSFYGAAKLACEAYISAACENHNIKAWVVRFPNVVGERCTHGVVYDFINKLMTDPHELLILGDGKQRKPYLYVKELVDAILFIWSNAHENFNIFNVSTNGRATVTQIAQIVAQQMDLADAELRYTGGKTGWTGDVPSFQYDASKLNDLGWKTNTTSAQAVARAVKAELQRRSLCPQ